MPLPFAHAAARPSVEAYLPAPLLHEGPLELLWWQWLAIPCVVVVAVAVGKVLGYLTRRFLGRLSKRTPTAWGDLLLDRLAPPITSLWSLATAYALKVGMALPEGAERHADQILKTLTVAVFFWAALRSIDLGFQGIAATPTAQAHALGSGLLPMLRKATKIAVFAMAVIAVLSDLGYPAASLLAGLGIGGLALALAAQKTVENLFGSISISVDQPFRVGDFVRLESGTMGAVEAIGLRSTRLRTLDRTVVTIPNGKLADQRIETFAARDRIRFSCTLGLVYGTTADQLRAVVEGADRIVRGHARVWPEDVSVRFVAISPSSLDVEVAASFSTADWNEFMAIRQDVLLALMDLVGRAGTALAYPTQTVHVAAGAATRGT